MTALMLRMVHFIMKFLICRRIDASVSLAWFKYIQMPKTFRRLLSSAIESPLILVLSTKNNAGKVKKMFIQTATCVDALL